jgi:hypothetical protein
MLLNKSRCTQKKKYRFFYESDISISEKLETKEKEEELIMLGSDENMESSVEIIWK